MKEAIKYYYNVYPKEISELDNGYYFFYNDFKYYFVKYNGDVSGIDLLVKMSNDLYNKNILVDTFILSRMNSFFVNVDEDVYVMLRVNSVENDIYSLKDIVYFNNLLISDNKKLESNWSTLWMKKIDDFEISISEINNEYPLIQESSSYYIGLAENAITYFNDTLQEEDISSIKINLNHKRVGVNKVYSGYINNPLTFTFDYEVRDVCEYIKYKFFFDNIDYDEVSDLILDGGFSRASLRLLYSRLLYPSYYLDAVKEIFINDMSEDVLIKFIDKISLYEKFLVYVYNLINKKFSIPMIPWIMEKCKNM